MSPELNFRDLCHRCNLAATHQRQVIYETVLSLHGHPSPELIYAKVRKKVPSISLATVYKNLRTFIESGMLREVGLPHGSLRVESNQKMHHHLVCVECKSITDLDEAGIDPVRLRQKLPPGFQVRRISVDVLGTCSQCSSRAPRSSRF